LIARADNDHYLIKKDPLTGEKLIENGEPYQKFEVGDAITYERDGKTIGLAMRSTGRLKLFLPELGRFVSFLLRTSSYIDSLYINEHLAAIQNVADMLNHGVAGGIPLDIYRVERDSPWQKDGQSHKGKQWFIHIEANKDWVQAAIQRMARAALGLSDAMAGLLQPVNVPIENMPEQAFTETDDESEPGATDEIDDSKVTTLDLSFKEPETEERKEEVPVKQMYRYNDDRIVVPVKKKLGFSTQETAVTLYEAYKKNKIGQALTIEEAEAFARNLIAPK
jgi:hypothetical protein